MTQPRSIVQLRSIAIFLAAPALVAAVFSVYYLFFRDGDFKQTNAPIILISVDTLRADAVSGFGAPPEQTPTMLQIGNDSIRFDTAVAPTHFTSASHATMLTGFSPYVHGTAITFSRTTAIPQTIPTIGSILQDAGYYTAGFTDAGQVIAKAGFDRGFDIFTAEANGIVDKIPKIEAFLDECKDKGKPFFLFAHTYRAHQPYRAPAHLLRNLLKNYFGVYADATRLAANTHARDAMEDPSKFEKLIGELSGARARKPADREFLHHLYNAGVTGADEEVKELITVLKNRDLYHRSMIIVTSDHGEAFFEHGVDSHKNVYDECLRVPLMIKLPGERFAGSRITETFPSVNLTPTILELAGVSHSLTFEGRSVARGIMKGHISDDDAFVNWHMSGADRIPRSFAVRSRSGKIIVETVGGTQGETGKDAARIDSRYYNIVDDPAETKNLAEAPDAERLRLDEALAKAKQRWETLRKTYMPGGVTSVEISDQESSQLRGIGYFR